MYRLRHKGTVLPTYYMDYLSIDIRGLFNIAAGLEHVVQIRDVSDKSHAIPGIMRKTKYDQSEYDM